MYEIEKGVPIPEELAPKQSSLPKWFPYPFDKMEIGDSFLVEDISKYGDGKIIELHRIMIEYQDETRKKFVRLPKHGRKGGETIDIRIWRIE